ncbi:MAG: DUF5320 domain-containing protein [Anaerolineae bacterium]
MGHRWMYYATGMPGWMRFGFSPGWLGRSPTGLGPCAEYLLTGRWPIPYGYGWGAAPAAYPWAGAPGFAGMWPQPTPEAELDALKAQANWLKSQLEAIDKRIAELEKTQ